MEDLDYIRQELSKIATLLQTNIQSKSKNKRKVKRAYKKYKGVIYINQKGSITKRKDGRYMGRYYDTSKKQKSVYARTKKECQEKLKNAIADVLENKKLIALNEFMLQEWLENYIQQYKVPVIKESTLVQLRSRVKNYVTINKPLSKLTYSDIKNIIDVIDSFNTKKYVYGFLKECFDKAKDLGYISFNPTAEIVLKKQFDIETIKDDDDYIVSHEQEKELLRDVPNNNIAIKYIIILMINTGLRIGEVFGLQKKDIDLVNNVIYINKQLNFLTMKYTSPKSKSSCRIVPLFNLVKEMLQESNLLNCDDEHYIFNYNIKGHLIYFLKKYNNFHNTNIKPHSFRKTFSSRCQFEKGINIKVVQKWLGHESDLTTQNYYSFISNNINKNAIEIYNKLDTQADTYTK